MRSIFCIFKKEVSLYMRPYFFIILTLASAYFSVYYFSILLDYANISKQVAGGNAELSFLDNLLVPYLSSINFVLLLICPFLVVKLFSQELQSNTFELLLTSPLTSWQIVLGKYLAACFIVTLFVLTAVLYLVISLKHVEIGLIHLLLGMFGLLLLAYVYVAISLFASSITSSVFLAGMLSIMICLALWLITIFRVQSDGSISTWVSEFWLGTHLIAFLKGGPSIKSISVFCSYIVFFLFLCQQVVESHRWR